jgi:DNA-binding transcriptional LysR family regulator
VSHSTVARRVEALEERLAARLFDRTRDGYTLTEAGRRMLDVAERVEREMSDLERGLVGVDERLEGPVALTCSDHFIAGLLLPDLADFCRAYPGIELCLTVDPRPYDLSRREADLALRATRPSRGDLVARKVVSTRTVPLGSADYVRALGTLRDVEDARWIVYGEDLATLASMRWLRAQSPRMVPALVTSSFPAQMAAARAGVGLVLAPIPFRQFAGLTAAKVSAALQRSLRTLPDDDLWLVGHRALRGVPRVAAVWQWLEALFAETPRR